MNNYYLFKMNEQLKKYILSLNCKIINHILSKLGSTEVCGWYCKSSSILRKEHHLKEIEKFIKENEIEYYISDSAENRSEFSIFINK